MDNPEFGAFAAALRERARVARRELRTARESGDAYAVQVAAGDLDGIVRLAREHDIDIDERAVGAADPRKA